MGSGNAPTGFFKPDSLPGSFYSLDELMEEGWIKLFRKIRSNILWQDKPFTKGQAFVDMLLRANHKDNEVLYEWKKVTISCGSFIASERDLARDWGWSRSRVTRYLRLLRDEGMIVSKPNPKANQITICNYKIYQQSTNQRKGHKRTSAEPEVNLNKNDKNVKNDKKYIYGEFENVKLTKEEHQKLLDRFKESGTNERIEALSSYIASKGIKYKSHYATILAWERKNHGNKKGLSQADRILQHPDIKALK